MAMHSLRSYLFAPADNQRILDKVFTAGADAVVVDLEDAVAPTAKAAARENLRSHLEGLSLAGPPPIWVRINPVGSGLWRDDLAAVVGPWLSGDPHPQGARSRGGRSGRGVHRSARGNRGDGAGFGVAHPDHRERDWGSNAAASWRSAIG